MPVGAAVAGILADRSLELAIVVLGIGGSILAVLATVLLVPRHDPAAIGAGSADAHDPGSLASSGARDS
jgi:hypothetical protein